MGTRCTLRAEGASRDEALERSIRAIESVEQRLSIWRVDSELSRLNAQPLGEVFELSQALLADLTRARHWTDRLEGAFDPGVGALIDLWDLRGEGRRPTDATLAAALSKVGFRTCISIEMGQATRARDGFWIDAGGFGKGAALDVAVHSARSASAKSFEVDLGGQWAWFGQPVRLGVADPISRHQAALTLQLPDAGSLATSGNSERGLTVDGQRIGHLLDPRTGRPAPDFGSITVFATATDHAAFDADALATGLFILGPERALQVGEELEGIEVLILHRTPRGDDQEPPSTSPSPLVVRATSGMQAWIRDLAPGVSLASDLHPPGRSKADPIIDR
ncbi:MAG: FAD:protein FMN transferase [Planctomycetota bacterium]